MGPRWDDAPLGGSQPRLASGAELAPGVRRRQGGLCPGGWVMTLNAFCGMMGWSKATNSGWTTGAKTGVRSTKDSGSHSVQLSTLARFLQAGLKAEDTAVASQDEYWDRLYRLDRSRDPFAYLDVLASAATRTARCTRTANRGSASSTGGMPRLW